MKIGINITAILWDILSHIIYLFFRSYYIFIFLFLFTHLKWLKLRHIKLGWSYHH